MAKKATIGIQKRTPFAKAAILAGTFGVGALLTACNNPIGTTDEPVPPYTGLDTTQTDTTKTDTTKTVTDSLDSWKPLTQIYIKGYWDISTEGNPEIDQDFGWHTVYSPDGKWNPDNSTLIYLLMPNGEKSAVRPSFYGALCSGNGVMMGTNEIAYFSDGTKGVRGCQDIPESERELEN